MRTRAIEDGGRDSTLWRAGGSRPPSRVLPRGASPDIMPSARIVCGVAVVAPTSRSRSPWRNVASKWARPPSRLGDVVPAESGRSDLRRRLGSDRRAASPRPVMAGCRLGGSRGARIGGSWAGSYNHVSHLRAQVPGGPSASDRTARRAGQALRTSLKSLLPGTCRLAGQGSGWRECSQS
jgi:hypothetical protein